MIQDHLQAIEEYVKKSNGQVNFRLREGELREKLLQMALKEGEQDELPGGPADAAEPADMEMQLTLGNAGNGVSFRVVSAGVESSAEWEVSKLDEKSLEYLERSLSRICDSARLSRGGGGRAIVKRIGEPDAYDQEGAAARLKVTAEWLKSVIPCSNYSYEEIEGRKYIREYYWNVDLVENLFRFKNTKIAPEDLQYVADQCCFGDLDWAKDLIARLKSPNRPEPTPKAQPKPQPKQGKPISRERMQQRNRPKKQA